jgi:Flp pilus assembly protein TadG
MRRPAQALVEFALAISIFMLLVLGTFDLARAYLAYTVVANAAREASRYAAAHVGEPTYLVDAVQAGKNLAVGIDGSLLTLTATTTPQLQLPAALQPYGPYIHVTGTYQFRSLTPGVTAWFGDPTTHAITILVDTSALAG